MTELFTKEVLKVFFFFFETVSYFEVRCTTNTKTSMKKNLANFESVFLFLGCTCLAAKTTKKAKRGGLVF